MELEVVKPRSQGRIRFWWSLVGFLVEQIDRDDYTKKNTDAILKICCGHCTPLMTPSGKEYMMADSIAFNKLGEDEFAELTRKAVRVAAKMLTKFGQVQWTPEEVERCQQEFEARWG